MSMSTYLEAAFINLLLRSTSFSYPTSWYVALFKADPTPAFLTANELSGGSYARVNVGSGGFVAPTNGVTSNTNVIQFPVATADWGTVTHFGICSALTGGNLWIYGPLTTPVSVVASNQLQFLAGQLTATFS